MNLSRASYGGREPVRPKVVAHPCAILHERSSSAALFSAGDSVARPRAKRALLVKPIDVLDDLGIESEGEGSLAASTVHETASGENLRRSDVVLGHSAEERSGGLDQEKCTGCP